MGGIIVLGGDYGRYAYSGTRALLGHASWQVSVSAVERIWRQEALTTSSRIRSDYALSLSSMRRESGWAGSKLQSRQILDPVTTSPSLY
ncbi:hypothetical protein [Sphingosinicella microcystinivorans]|nr:hypothetical protein [Sphingosinicella microcystinivorans]